MVRDSANATRGHSRRWVGRAFRRLFPATTLAADREDRPGGRIGQDRNFRRWLSLRSDWPLAPSARSWNQATGNRKLASGWPVHNSAAGRNFLARRVHSISLSGEYLRVAPRGGGRKPDWICRSAIRGKRARAARPRASKFR